MDVVSVDVEPHEIKNKEVISKKSKARFIGWDYTASNLALLDSASDAFCHFVIFFYRFEFPF